MPTQVRGCLLGCGGAPWLGPGAEGPSPQPRVPAPEQDCRLLQQLSVTLYTFLLVTVPESAVKTIIRDKVTIGK